VGAYIVRRSLFLPPLLFLGSILVFTILRVAPGDPVSIVLGPEATDAERQQLRDTLGLSDPMPVQYLKWMGNMLTFKLGNSIITNQPIGEQIVSRLPVTLEIWVLSLILGTTFGVSFGILSAVYRDSMLDYVIRFLAVLFLSVPAFFALTLLIVIPSVLWNYVPPLKYASPLQDLGTNLRMFLPPVFILSLESSAGLMRLTRSVCLDALNQDYIRTARAKGLRELVVINRHMLKNAMIPVVTVIGARIPGIISGSVILEQVMSLAGMGQFIYQAVLSKDYPIVQALSFYIGALVIIAHIAVDVSYAYFDPRIRYR